MSDDKQYCTFFLDDLFLAVEVTKVQEIIRYQNLSTVPLSPAVVSGLMNLRGQIVMAIDMRRRLDLKPRDRNQLPLNVVIKTEEDPVSLLVDEIGDVMVVSEPNFEEAPETLRGSARDMIRGAYKLKDRLLLVLDTEKVVSI